MSYEIFVYGERERERSVIRRRKVQSACKQVYLPRAGEEGGREGARERANATYPRIYPPNNVHESDEQFAFCCTADRVIST